MDDSYEIHAIRYAHLERRSPENFLGGDAHDVPMPLDYFVWLVRNQRRAVLVDTGFDEPMARKRGRNIVRPVGEGLAALGLSPDSIETVVVTHMHYDHAGNLPLFPHARFHVQDREMAFVTGRCMCHGPLRHSVEAEHVIDMVRLVFTDRVQFHDGSAEIAPGIEVHHIGGHTPGIQAVRVRTRRGWVVLASDASHFYAHMEQGRAFPVVSDVAAMLEGHHRLRALASSPAHVIPGHDPLVMTRYPASSDALAGWVARLDADPLTGAACAAVHTL